MNDSANFEIRIYKARGTSIVVAIIAGPVASAGFVTSDFNVEYWLRCGEG